MAYTRTEWVNDVTPINSENLNKIEEQLERLSADYVVEQGVSGIWHYEKWSSGRIKLWGYERRYGITTDNENDGVYRKVNNLFYLPTTLGITDIYFTNATAGAIDRPAWSGQHYFDNEKMAVSTDVFFGQQVTDGVTVNFYVEAVGTWK